MMVIFTRFILAALIVLLPVSGFAESGKTGQELLTIDFDVPQAPGLRAYLGVGDTGTFRLNDIEARVLIVEIFSMYCPFCQREAPNVNTLYDLLTGDGGPGPAVKIIGIGVGNSEFEVNYFRETYTVEFPLFADPDFIIHKLLGEVRTPYFIGFRLDREGDGAVFMSRPGELGDANLFLKQVLSDAGLDD